MEVAFVSISFIVFNGLDCDRWVDWAFPPRAPLTSSSGRAPPVRRPLRIGPRFEHRVRFWAGREGMHQSPKSAPRVRAPAVVFPVLHHAQPHLASEIALRAAYRSLRFEALVRL